MSYIGREYRELEQLKEWELLWEGTYLVLLNTGVRSGCDRNLVGVSCKDLRVRWELGGTVENPGQYDGIVKVYVRAGAVWAGTWSGYALRFEPETGKVLETRWTK